MSASEKGKVTSKAFREDPGRYLDEVSSMDGPLVITSGKKTVAALMSKKEYDEVYRRLEGYERMMKNMEKAEKARMEAHAGAMAEISRRGRKLR